MITAAPVVTEGDCGTAADVDWAIRHANPTLKGALP